MSATQFTVRASNTPLVDDDGEDEPIGVITNATIDNEQMSDIVADSTHSGGSASVTLLPEEVLRLTKAESGRIFNSNHCNTSNNNSSSATSATPPSLHPQVSQATSEGLSLSVSRVDSNGDENDSGKFDDPPSATMLLTEQVLQLTMNDEDDDLEEDNSRNNNPANSYPRQTSKNKKTQRKKPKRSKSGNSTGSAGKLKKAVKKEKKSMEAVVAAAISNYGGSVPNNSEGGDIDQKDSSLQKARTSGKKKNKSHYQNKNSNKASVETPGSASSPIKKKRRGRRPHFDEERNAPVQRQPEVQSYSSPSEIIDREAEDLPVDENNDEDEGDYDIEAPLPPQLSEQISTSSIQSFQSIDRAGAIAVFPSASSHITQRRSINRPINDIDNDFDFNYIVAEENARQESSSRDLTSTLNSYEEIPEPPKSQVINATATHFHSSSATPPRSSLPPQPHSSSATATTLLKTRTQIPAHLPIPSVGSQSWTPSAATSVTNETTATSSSLSQLSSPHNNLSHDSSTDNDDDFIAQVSVGDAGSGTVTAKAISSQDYYEEVRRQLQEEAVVAVDVIPLTEGGLPVHKRNDNITSSSGAHVYSTNSGRKDEIKNGKIDYDDNGPGSNLVYCKRIQKKYLWIFGAIGILIVALIIVLVIFANRRQLQNPTQIQLRTQAPSSDNSVLVGVPDDDNIPIVESTEPQDMRETEMGLYWRRVISEILPKSTLETILLDPEHMSPHYMAFSYLVENAEELFNIKNMEEILTEREKSKVSTVFALVMLYHCMDGPNWFVKTNWLRADVSFCHWHGINCKGDLIPKQNYQNLDATTTDSKEYGIPFAELLDIPPPGDIDDLVMMGESKTSIGTDDGFFNSGAFNAGADDDRQDGEEYSEVYDRDDDFADETWDEFFVDKIPIHSLDLKANNLKGVFPDEIGLLTNIYGAIDLSSNGIVGSIPIEFGMLSKLQCMLLHSNKLENALPSELGTMTNLRKFDISSNTAITGSVPNTLKRWTRIEELEIQDTGLTGSVPIGVCQTLESRSTDFIFKHVDELAFRASCSNLNVSGDGMGVDCMCCTECCYRDNNGFEQCFPAPAQEDD